MAIRDVCVRSSPRVAPSSLFVQARGVWVGIAVSIVAVSAVGARVWFGDERKFKRRMLALPLASSIAETPEESDVRVSGTLAYVEGTAPLVAPFSKRKCASWRVVAEHKDGATWKQILHDAASTSFILHDESGRALVEGASLTLALHVDAKGQQGAFSGTSPSVLSFCKDRDIETERFDSYRSLRIWESILEEGETVSVGGRGRFENDPMAHAGYRGSKLRLRVSPLESGELLVSDDATLSVFE